VGFVRVCVCVCVGGVCMDVGVGWCGGGVLGVAGLVWLSVCACGCEHTESR